MIVLWVVLAVIAVIILAVLLSYNGLIVARNRVREAYSEIDVQLKRRSSLIPNLVETVKGYAKHEKGIFESVSQARAALMSAKSPKESAEANNQLTGALKSLFAIAEAYPQLKASDNFKELQEELSDTETKVAAARQFYNVNVLDYNTSIQTFPGAMIASLFHFTPEEFFQATDEEKADVQVRF